MKSLDIRVRVIRDDDGEFQIEYEEQLLPRQLTTEQKQDREMSLTGVTSARKLAIQAIIDTQLKELR